MIQGDLHLNIVDTVEPDAPSHLGATELPFSNAQCRLHLVDPKLEWNVIFEFLSTLFVRHRNVVDDEQVKNFVPVHE